MGGTMVKMNELDGKAGSLSPTPSHNTVGWITSRALSSYLKLTAPVWASSTSWCLQVYQPLPPSRRRSTPFLPRGSAPSARARTAWPTATRSPQNWSLHHPPQPGPIHLPTSVSEKQSPTIAQHPSSSKRSCSLCSVDPSSLRLNPERSTLVHVDSFE